MASRDDVLVLWNLDPRLILVADPSTEITIQDLHDTLRDIEQEPANLIYPTIVDSAGKENLGGGTFVGVTTTLQNAHIGFQSRKTWTTSGLSSSLDTTGAVLQDASAQFVSSGVVPGAWVMNLTDGSIATALTVDSETQITTDFLGGGTDNQFEIGDIYKVLNVTQVEVAGGNLVAVDEFETTIDAIFPTAGTQAVRAAATTATIQSQLQLEHSTFNGAVTVDTTKGITGTEYPTGTQQQPSNNFADARTVALSRGFNTIRIVGNATIGLGDDISDFVIVGDNASRTLLTVLDPASTVNVEIREATVTGIFDTQADFRDCHLVDIQFVEANIHSCILGGTITLAGTGLTSLYDCNDGLVEDAPPPTIDFNGSGKALAVRNYYGDIELVNKTGGENVEFNMVSGGRIRLDSTVTSGLLRLTGIMEVLDNTPDTAIVDVSEVIFPDQVQLGAFNRQVTLDITSSFSGTEYPVGLRSAPVNNFGDAVAIANNRGLHEIYVIGSMTMGATRVADELTILGEDRNRSHFFLTSGVSTQNTTFGDCTISGVVDGTLYIRDSVIGELSNIGVNGEVTTFENCGLDNTLLVDCSADLHLFNCYSTVAGGDNTATIDFAGLGSDMVIRNYNGGLTFSNNGRDHSVSVDMNSGQVVFDNTVTSGVFTIRGLSKLVNNSGPLTTVNTESLIYPDELQLSAFDGNIFIDPLAGSSGIEFPLGTHSAPVNNLADAKAIGFQRGLDSFIVRGTIVCSPTDNLDNLKFRGENPLTSVMVLGAGCSTDRTTFDDMILTGELGGPVFCTGVGLQSITNIGSETFPSLFDRCILRAGTQTMASGLLTPQNIHFIDCLSGIPGPNPATIDYNGTTSPIAFRNYAGGLNFININGGNDSTIGNLGGKVTFDSSCTNGTVALDGILKLTDNSGPGFVIDHRSHISAPHITQHVWNEPIASYTTSDTFGERVGSKLLTFAKWIGLK